jgi:HAD superfamily hydrolase (TIGR01509 family)
MYMNNFQVKTDLSLHHTMNKKKKLSAVIFDCDGVMFDSRQANINFYNHILAHFDLPPMDARAVDFVHMHTAEESVRHIFQGSPYTEEAQAFRSRMDYRPFIKDMVIEPGLKELLRSLKSRLHLAVATNRSNTIGDVLKVNGLSDYFDIVVSSLDVNRPKPHPEAICKILSHFRIAPKQAVYIGDSVVDYETAKAAGVCFVAFRNNDLGALYEAECMMEIESILRKIESLIPDMI